MLLEPTPSLGTINPPKTLPQTLLFFKKHFQEFTHSLFLSPSFSTFQPSISSPDLQMHLDTFPDEFCSSGGADTSRVLWVKK